MIGSDAEEFLEVDNSLTPHPPPAEPRDYNALAVATPDVQQLVAQEEAAQSAIKAARAGFLPTLAATGSVGKGSTVMQYFPQDDRWSVGVTLTIPIFDGGRDYYGVKSAAALWSAGQNNRVSVDRATLLKIKRAYMGYVEAEEHLVVDTDYRDAATLRAEIGRAKYNNGLLSFQDWDGIENDLIVRQKNYLGTARDRIIAEATWAQAIGKGVGE